MELTNKSKTMSDWEPYILGQKYTKESSDVVRLNEELLEKFISCIKGDDIVKQMFDMCDNAKTFYDATVDFKSWIPKQYMKELFYAAKLKKYSLSIPCFAQFLLEKAWAEADGIPNLMIKLLPATALHEFCAKGYFLGGLSLREVICNVCTEDYTPISSLHLRNKLSTFTEIYVEETDMVAAVPHKVADSLSDEAIRNITLTPMGLAVGDRLISTFGGYFGAINSHYDMRELV